MLWIGLTGGIASGKSTAAKIFYQLGFPVVDADQIAKQVVALGTPGLAQIVKSFGPGILKPNQSLDRKKLAALVFSDPNNLSQLEAIIHPLVKQSTLEARTKEEKKGAAMVFYDIPLLFEKQMQDEFDYIIVISCSEAEQKARLKARDGMSEQEITERLKNQISLSEKEKQADFVVRNEKSLDELKIELQRISAAIQSQSQQNQKA